MAGKKLLIIDGNSILNRQFYGIRPLTTKSGIHTNAAYGFLKVLLGEVEKIEPEYCAVAFDVHEPTFRHKIYEEYKAGRRSTPPELLMQFPYAKRLIKALGIAVIEKGGYEADDALGTITAMAEREGAFSYILTGDRDALQLIGDSTHVLLATNSEVIDYGKDEFRAKYGVSVEQFVDVKALMGDSSDNIPGVRGIGEKTAVKLIAEYGSLDGIYAAIDSVKAGAKVIESLKADKESAYMSQRLAKIDRDAPFGIDTLDEIKIGARDYEALEELLDELEFGSFKERLLSGREEQKSERRQSAEITTADLFEIKWREPVALVIGDRESENEDDENNKIIEICDGVRFCSFDCRDISEISDFLAAHKFVVCDLKKMLHEVGEAGGASFSCAFDVMLAAYVLSPTDGSYELSKLSQIYLHDGSEDAVALYELAAVLADKLRETQSERLYYDIEQPLAGVLYKMEKIGFEVDKEGLKNFSKMLGDASDKYLFEIYELAGHPFNVNSTKQLASVLFDELGLPVIKKTKSGYSTDAEVLEKLRPYAPIVDHILSYRQVAKLKSTYADGLLAAADENSRVHSSFNQTVTATGRLSSTEPNLQNIPIRTPLGHEMRKCFVAPDGCVLVDADYSQIELRLLAHISADPVMIEAFNSGEDIHRSTASRVFGVPLDEVTPELRKRAKAINFGIVYGMGGFSLASDIGVSKKEADAYIAGYKDKYKGVSEYLSAIVESAYRNGFVQTMFGRRRYIPELSSSKASMKNFGERVAMNSPIQGSAADIIKIAMINVQNALDQSGIDARLVLQVHDELILEASEKDAPAAEKLLKEQMESAVSLLVPLSVEVSRGKTWFDCK